MSLKYTHVRASVVVVVVDCRCPQCSNIFSSETTRPIKAKFHVEPFWEGGTKVKASRTGSPITLKLGMQHWGLKFFQVYINVDPGLTLTYFTGRSNLVTNVFLQEKVLFCFVLIVV